MSSIAKPFLKWAGGKGQLLDRFQKLYPQALQENKIENYYEPFLGSGAVFFDMVQNYNVEHAYLYDTNPDLIITYQVIRKDVESLIERLYLLQTKYIPLDKSQRQQYFYELRTAYNLQRNNVDPDEYSEQWLERAAQLIFLNRTCFNGLYRVNSRGEFNTPVGDYKNPKICDKENLRAVHRILKKTKIQHADFTQVEVDLKKNSFVYFDPPYRPISKTASFKAYGKEDFSDKRQRELAELFARLDKKGACVLLSNSDPKNNDPGDNFFDDLYRDYSVIRVPAKRIINSNPSKRGAVNEIIVTNYSMKRENILV